MVEGENFFCYSVSDELAHGWRIRRYQIYLGAIQNALIKPNFERMPLDFSSEGKENQHLSTWIWVLGAGVVGYFIGKKF